MRKESIERRHKRIRKKIFGTSTRPRVCVFRSNKHIYASLVDDEKGRVILTVSTRSKEFNKNLKNYGNVEAAYEVGKLFAKKVLERGYKKVVFDRSGYLYHGRVKALAEAARKEGLEF
jgi:large subunit ribosomal protein L18